MITELEITIPVDVDLGNFGEHEVVAITSLTLLRREGDVLHPLLHATARIVSQHEAQQMHDAATGADDFFTALAKLEEAEHAVEED